MADVYAELVRSLAAGEKAVLARIIRQSGSAPRTVGTTFLIRSGGDFVGTIGGGRLEHDVLGKARDVLSAGRTAILHFRLSGREVAASEMLCGGMVDVLLEPVFPADEAALPVFQNLTGLRDRGRSGVLVTAVADGIEGGGRILIADDGSVSGEPSRLPAAAPLAGARKMNARQPSLLVLEEAEGQPALFVEPVEAEPVLLLFGAGHISTFVAPLARMAGFRISVVDDRAEFANPERFPAADRILVCPIVEAFQQLAVTPSTYIAIVTRGHIHDRDALRAALATRPAYIGMIGSRRKRDMIYASLMDEGIPAADLQQVHSPIGLPIGAQTPEEIAVSIVAELIQARARKGGGDPARPTMADTAIQPGARP